MLLSRFIDKSLWALFLIMIFALPLMPPFIEANLWSAYMALVFLSIGFYVLCCNEQIERRSQRSIKAFLPIFILLVLSVFWQWLQLVLPGAHSLVGQLENSSIDAWFNPQNIVSVSVDGSWWQILFSLYLLGFSVLSLLLINKRRRLNQLLWLLALTVVIHAVIGIVAKFQGTILVDRAALDGHYEVARGVFVNRTHFAGFIVLASVGILSFLFRRIWQSREGFSLSGLLDEVLSVNLLFYMGLILILFAMALSQSRAGFLGILVASLIVLLVSAYYKRRLNLKAVLLVFLSLVCLSIVFAGQGLITRLGSESLSLGERTLQWAVTLEAIKDRWFSGYGPGSYALVFQAYRDYSPLREVVFDQAHNYWLTIWLEQGLPGLIIQISIAVLAIKKSISNLRNERSTLVNGVSLACLFTLICAIIQSLVDFNLQVVNLTSVYFLTIALVYLAPCISRKAR